ncbi:hypothetical protein Acj133p031 [Acinetobacter phage 133]|uniref:Uncharacterized protein n=1 Tax=Acinetobacter phage 133 TaxID=2919552 RepID=D9I5Z7_9CAUD|nr:hypothetical protein Acj133p031 [Acinetobacter phage 133]ADJ19378.1 hypothetical protein Acj133p031 [Acinetobacter phage 133]
MDNLILNLEQVAYLREYISDVKDLLDNVHCYDTDEYKDANVAMAILNGASLERAKLENPGDEDV